MPPRHCLLCDINHEAHHYENGDDDLPPPPPPPPFNDGIYPALVQFMADTTRHPVEAISWIPRPNERVEHIGCSLRDFSSYHFPTFEGIEGQMLQKHGSRTKMCCSILSAVQTNRRFGISDYS
jgi:hypothetical protein